MSYHVNASSHDGAMSVPALTLEQALAKADEFKAKGYMGVIIIDAGTGEPFRGQPATIQADSVAVATPPNSPAEDNTSSHETSDLIVALQATSDDQ